MTLATRSVYTEHSPFFVSKGAKQIYLHPDDHSPITAPIDILIQFENKTLQIELAQK